MQADNSAGTKTVLLPVTVILSTYNRARYVERSIESILDQSLSPSQVIVVDDGSTDETAKVLERFGERIELVRKVNGGKAAALNLAFSRARGELIWIFDDDDIALPDALEKLTLALAQHPQCGFSYGAYDHVIEQEDGNLIVVDPKLRIDRSLDFKLSVLERCYIFQPALLVRRSCYEALGPFDESLVRSQDYEMLLRLTRRFEGIYVDSIVFHQRQHSGVRGTAAAPIAQKETGWIKFDRQIFTRIYREYRLSEYVAGKGTDDRNLSVAEQRLALLERSCVMTRKGMWDFAAADMRAFSALLKSGSARNLTRAEAAVLTRFVGPYSYADHTLGEAGVFVGTLNELSPLGLRLHALALLLRPWFAEMGRSVRDLHVRVFLGTARKCLRFLLMLRHESNQSENPVASVRNRI